MDVSLCLNGLGDKPLIPIADLPEAKTKYSAAETECRNKLASLYRLVDLFHWSQAIYNHITLRVPGEKHEILINPLGLLYREITASSFVKITCNGQVVDAGSTPLGINQAGYILHTAIHEARPDVQCVLHLHTAVGSAVASMECGLLPINQESMIIGKVAYHTFGGMLSMEEEKAEIVKQLGDKKVIFLRNHGFVCCGTSVEEAFHLAYNTMIACKSQVAALSAGHKIPLIMPSEAAKKQVFEIALHGANGMNRVASSAAAERNGGAMVHSYERMADIFWGVGELEWEAWMRQLDGAGYKTGHNYKLPQLVEVIKKCAAK